MLFQRHFILWGIVILMIGDCKISYPKKSLSLLKFKKSQISVLQLVEEPTLEQSSLTLQQQRLEFDQDLLKQQELIEADIQEFPKSPTPPPQELRQQILKKQQMNQILMEYLKKPITRILLYVISVFSAVLYLLIKLSSSKSNQKQNKKRKNEEEAGLIQNEDYSIMNSKTISSEASQIKFYEQKYKLTEYPAQYKNPYEESFVKASLRGTTKGSTTGCDQSLLEIDELLNEMLGQ